MFWGAMLEADAMYCRLTLDELVSGYLPVGIVTVFDKFVSSS